MGDRGLGSGRGRGRQDTLAAVVTGLNDASRLLQEVEGLTNLGGDLVLSEDSPQRLKDFADAVTLWTNGAVDVVRDPTLHDGREGTVRNRHIRQRIGVTATTDWTTIGTKAKYQTANRIMAGLASRPVPESERTTLWGGLEPKPGQESGRLPGVARDPSCGRGDESDVGPSQCS